MTSLSQRLGPLLKAHPDQSGTVSLGTGQEALVARIASIRQAEHSIDLQYYIWHNDLTGKFLLYELILAANRGVKVRLLLDYLNQSKLLKELTFLESHPHIEVRLTNPFYQYVNHRMHNKSLIADNQIAIVGGRNIGDEYFDASGEMNFNDFDLFTVGPVVNEVSIQFDQYWNYERSFSISEVNTTPLSEKEIIHFSEQFAKSLSEFQKSPYIAGLKNTELARKFSHHENLNPYWGKAELLFDPPQKLKGKNKKNLSSQIRPGFAHIQKELVLISPYLIPGKSGMNQLKKLRKRGVRIVILTNSLASNDVLSVFGGYKKYREDILKLGIELYEMRPRVANKKTKKKSMGSSGSSGLHGKVIISDRRDVIVGSMNLDRRSKNLNTEMGIRLLDTPLAEDMTTNLLKELPEVAYKVELDGKELQWVQKDGAKIKTFDEEPETTKWMRTKAWFSGLLIPEEML